MSKLTINKAAVLAVALTSMFALSACDVDQTKEGEMPEVSVEGGQMPEYDVETAEVEVGTETRTIEVPTAEITMPDEQDNAEGEEAPQQ